MILLYKTIKCIIEFFRYLFLIVAIPLIIPTIATMEIIDTIQYYIETKIKDLKNGKRT